jgi:hypothetical protein
METTDVGDWGANTTFYFGLDQITIRPIKQETSIESLITPNTQLNVYPNPCRDILYINGVNYGETINIYNIHGQLLISQTLNTPTASIHIPHLAPGVYIIKQQNKTAKIIKQ